VKSDSESSPSGKLLNWSGTSPFVSLFAVHEIYLHSVYRGWLVIGPPYR